MGRPVSAGHVSEMRRRDERRFAEARDALGASNMNDTKWHEVFRVLDGTHVGAVSFRMKIVGRDYVWEDRSYRPVNRKWTDSTNGPIEHRHIEWLEVTGGGAKAVEASLQSLGALPLLPVDGGFRLQAYGPLSARLSGA